MQPARSISVSALAGKSRRQIENLLKRHYGSEAGQESIFRPEKPKLKAKERREMQKKRAGVRLRQEQDEFNRDKRINKQIVRRRRAKKAAKRRGWN